MKVGMLTGGGDCPGLNAVIRAAVRTLHNNGHETLGLLEGWRGAVEGNSIELNPVNTDEIISHGGTILGSSRTNPYSDPHNLEKLVVTFKRLELDALIAIGGDDTLGVCDKLSRGVGLEQPIPAVGCPKTIDNDLSATDCTFGFYTALDTVVDSCEKLRTTIESHRRVGVVEVMGRNAGWIAWYGGIAAGADYILAPEVPVEIEKMCHHIKQKFAIKNYAIVVVSEGVKLPEIGDVVKKDQSVDQFGHGKYGGIGEKLAKEIKERTGLDTRDVNLGHLQRGGPPNAFDRVLCTRLGVHAAELVMKNDFGKMVALRGTGIAAVPLSEAVGATRLLSDDVIKEGLEFFGNIGIG